MYSEAQKRIGHLYPPVEITAEISAGSAGILPARPDLKPLIGQNLTVIAWLWARTVIEEAVGRTKQECATKNRCDIWEVFSARLLRPLFDGAEPPDYEALVRQFHFQSPTEAANVLTTAKRMFRRNLEAVVGEYAEAPADIGEELRELQAIVARAP
jgi:hypothetical protein